MKELRSKAIVMLVNTKEGDFEKMPIPVRKELAKPELGNMIPRLAVFDKKSKKALGSLAYEQIGNKKAMRTLENAMREYAKNGAKNDDAEEEEDEDKPADDSETEESDAEEKTPSKVGKDGTIKDTQLTEWTSVKGTKINAKATRYKDGKLTLVRKNGTSVQVTLAQLDADSRKAAEELIGE